MVRVMGKGGKERLLPFNQSALDALRAWIDDRAVILARASAKPRRRAEGLEASAKPRSRETDPIRCSSTIAAPA